MSLKIFGFLNGLGREYDPITTVIQYSLSKTPQPTFNDVISDIQSFDSRLQSYEDLLAVNPTTAFNTQRTEYNDQYRNYNQRGRGRSSFNRGRGGYSSRGRGFSQQNNNASTGERPTCQICGRVGHTALKCYNRFDNNYQPAAYATMRNSDETGKEWYPDSGASAHVTASTNNVQSAHPYEGNDTVMVGDGTFLPITYVGSTTLTTSSGTLSLNEVLICLGIKKSLLSVSKVCDDHPCGVYFDANKVCIIDIPTQKVVAKGPKHNGLYMLESQEFVTFFSNRQCSASEDIWHCRLGHANSKLLQHLHNSKEIYINKSSTTSVCEPYQMGKSSKLQFFSSSSRVEKPLEKIHCDLWGPSPVVSNQGFKYYAVFVDEYSRYTWFYPMKLKSEFYSIFLMFQKFVEN